MNVAVICSDYRPGNLRLQPWRFVSEVAEGLRHLGHNVTVITNAGESAPVKGSVMVRSTRLGPGGNSELESAIDVLRPDICLWNFGVSSALHFAPSRIRWPSCAVFTSPMPSARELVSLGASRLLESVAYTAIHLAGSLVPRRVLARALSGFRAVLVQSTELVAELARCGVPVHRLHHIGPSIDEDFRVPLPPATSAPAFNLVFMGSPLPVRGIFDLVDAVALVRDSAPAVRLRVLSRGSGEYAHYEARLGDAIRRGELGGVVSVRSGNLSRSQLLDELRQAHAVALPFQVVPSDAPLAVFEAMALGRPVLGTNVAGLREHLRDGRGFLASAGSPRSIAELLRHMACQPQVPMSVRERALGYIASFGDWGSVAKRVERVLHAVVET